MMLVYPKKTTHSLVWECEARSGFRWVLLIVVELSILRGTQQHVSENDLWL